MNLATIAQFQAYIYTLLGVFLGLYVFAPLALSLIKDIPAEALVFWHKLRLVLFVAAVLGCGIGAAKQYFQNVVPNSDMPDGRQSVQDHVNSYERKVSK